jgi:hypothetical protein
MRQASRRIIRCAAGTLEGPAKQRHMLCQGMTSFWFWKAENALDTVVDSR